MKKNIIFILVMGVFLTLNFNDLRGFYYTFLGNKNYKQGDFELARKYYKKNENIGKSFYKEKKYKEAIKYFTKSEEDYKNLYNLGNAYFRIGEQEQPRKNWEKSVDFYRKSLGKKYDKKTEKNLDFVLERLKSLSEEKQSPHSNFSKEDGEESNENTTKKDTSENTQDSGEEKNPGKGNEDEAQSNPVKNKRAEKLSSEEKDAIQKYTKELQKSEGQYGEYFGKVYKEANTSEFDAFFNDPFFDNSLLDEGNNDNVKDW